MGAFCVWLLCPGMFSRFIHVQCLPLLSPFSAEYYSIVVKMLFRTGPIPFKQKLRPQKLEWWLSL